MRRPGAPAIAAFAAFTAFIAAPACADLYTWTDAQGRVQYSDQVPKDFKGPVKKVETGDSAVIPLSPPKGAKEEAKPSGKSAVADKRRAERDRLGHGLDAAREKLAAARKALAEGQDPKPDENQIVQRPAQDPKAAPMVGNIPAATRANCRTFEQDGKKVTVCPVSMPNEAYFERIAKLEAAVKAAEEEVTAAERAYRRGVD